MLSKEKHGNIVTAIRTALTKTYQFLSLQLFNIDSFLAYIEPIVQQINPNWRHGRIQATVTNVKQENASIYSISVEPTKDWKGFKAGQHIQVTAERDGALMTRTFSLASSPAHFKNSGEVVLTIREIEDGAITPWLRHALSSGSIIYISQASGQFTLRDNKQRKIFIAGGSGITPIHSILSNSISKTWFQDAELFFYVRDQSHLFYESQLRRLAQAGLTIHTLYTEEGSPYSIEQLKGLINHTHDTDFYLCGPTGLIQKVEQDLVSLGAAESNIFQEHFTASSAKNFNLEDLDLGEDFIQVDYLDSKKQSRYQPEQFIGESASTLLDIAEEEGLSPVAGCRMGVCHQCICKKKNGRVLNTKTGQYSDSGEEEIQLCISVPAGPVELEL